jgi:hypothetical protein
MKENELVQRLVWAALLAGFGAIATAITARAAAAAFRQIFDGEDPPE